MKIPAKLTITLWSPISRLGRLHMMTVFVTDWIAQEKHFRFERSVGFLFIPKPFPLIVIVVGPDTEVGDTEDKVSIFTDENTKLQFEVHVAVSPSTLTVINLEPSTVRICF